MHHGIVLLRIEGLALRLNAGDAQLLQHCQKLPADQLHALPMGVALGELGKATLQIIQHPQKLLDGIRLGVGVDVFLFLGGALAVVIVFRRQTQILVAGIADHFSQLLHLLHLLTGDGKGLLLGGLFRSLLRFRGGVGLRLLLLRGVLLFFLTHDCSSLVGGSCRFSNI